MMELNYDEDLMDNFFFQVLQSEHSELFSKATMDGWVICVPRAGSLPKYALTDDDFYSHIFIPSDELPETHFRTLNDRDVRICNRVINVEPDDLSTLYSTHVLFEETYYTEDLLKYKVLCIENPLQSSIKQKGQITVITVQTLRDCIDFLWTESGGKEVLEKMDDAIQQFIILHDNLELKNLQVQRDLVGGLYSQCLQIVIRDSRFREKNTQNRHFLDIVKVSVESYIHHGIYKKLIQSITVCTAYEDAVFNKIVRNLSDIQLRDLDIRSDFSETIPKARSELARVDGYSTILGKVGCLKRTVAAISKNECRDHSQGNIVAADDLLPMLVFLVIKAGLANWIANLTFLKQFCFSASCNDQVGQNSFLVTSLEAAIEHVRSGLLIGPSAPEAQFDYEQQTDEVPTFEMVGMVASRSTTQSSLCKVFEVARVGNLEELQQLLSNNSFEVQHVSEEFRTSLCHPLCSCDKCESQISHRLCNTAPSVHSCDDRGFTVLHVASLYGRPKVVDFLLSHGAKCDIADYSGSVPLHYASARGHQNAVLLLLQSGATIDVQDNEGNTPLHFAVSNGHDGCVKALLYFAEHACLNLDVNCKTSLGDTPLHHAARWGYGKIVDILLNHGANPSLPNKRKLTPLDCAHSLHISQLLLSKRQVKPAMNVITAQHLNPVAKTIIGDTSKMRFDFDDDCKTECSSKDCGVRPLNTEQIRKVDRLLKAITYGDVPLARFYLGLKPKESKASDKSSCHPLCACKLEEDEHNSSFGDTKCNDGLDLDVCNSEGFTPLHVAAMHGRTELVALLLEAGAKQNVKSRVHLSTPLQLACQSQWIQSAKHLLDGRNCDLNWQDVRGNTALHYACNTRNARLVELLLQYSPRLNLRNQEGKTPLIEAEEKMSLTLVRLLSAVLVKSDEKRPSWELRIFSIGEVFQVIFGPMFSGKTTELIRRLKRYQFADYDCLVVRYAKDDRYSQSGIATHDQQSLAAVQAVKLSELSSVAHTYNVIGIDEAQFFPDAVEFCERMANIGKIVIVAALDGTYQRTGFGDILNLVPLAESVVKLTAVCMSCFSDAAYTKRIGNEKEVEIIGGAEMYMAVCRECHQLSSPVKRSPFKRHVPASQNVSAVPRKKLFSNPTYNHHSTTNQQSFTVAASVLNGNSKMFS